MMAPLQGTLTFQELQWCFESAKVFFSRPLRNWIEAAMWAKSPRAICRCSEHSCTATQEHTHCTGGMAKYTRVHSCTATQVHTQERNSCIEETALACDQVWIGWSASKDPRMSIFYLFWCIFVFRAFNFFLLCFHFHRPDFLFYSTCMHVLKSELFGPLDVCNDLRMSTLCKARCMQVTWGTRAQTFTAFCTRRHGRRCLC